MKKLFTALIAVVMTAALFAGCKGAGGNNGNSSEDTGPLAGVSAEIKNNLSADGYVKGKIPDFSVYENTDSYRKVKTADELISALADAKIHYSNVWDDATSTYTQVPAEGYTQENFKGTVRVIEIENDLNLGYEKLSAAAKSSGIVEDFSRKTMSKHINDFNSDTVKENGISQIKVENTSDLLVYSKSGAKLTHCGFKLTSDNNVVFRNLEFDEIWQWEDSPLTTASAVGDYDWHGWAYFKIAFCGYVWIDHCTFGKSYDGQIDYSNPDYSANAGVAFRAPYGADGGNGLHISWCKFNAGSDDADGYIYKMMSAIESDYQFGGNGCLYYKALRNGGATFEDILYGLAIPQKKGFLCGDSGDKYEYNLKLRVSFANCTFKNLEDRLPKLRGGNAYMYNCIVDNSQYYAYRSKLKALNVASLVAAVNSKWKCALVSQGIVCGNGGSVRAENCIYSGIDTLLKNNDSNTAELVKGGYELVNCSYDRTGDGDVYVGSSSDAGNKFTNNNPNILSAENFSWHTADGLAPFTVSAVSLDKLKDVLSATAYGAGVNASLGELYLKNSYSA